MSHLDVPVLLVIHRRTALTRRVFEAIAKARPRRLFVAADGPATAADREACELTRAVVQDVDWDCEVLRDFSDHNLGLDGRMTSALNWVFGEAEAAIVLEDDCLPDARFFGFCAELLDRYEHDLRVVHISGECYRNRREGDCSRGTCPSAQSSRQRSRSLVLPHVRAFPDRSQCDNPLDTTQVQMKPSRLPRCGQRSN